MGRNLEFHLTPAHFISCEVPSVLDRTFISIKEYLSMEPVSIYFFQPPWSGNWWVGPIIGPGGLAVGFPGNHLLFFLLGKHHVFLLSVREGYHVGKLGLFDSNG